MGQRFQAFVITTDRDNNDYVHGYHLQWCWGHHTISRLYQFLKFAKDDCKYKFSNLNSRWECDFKSTQKLVESLIALNIYNNSYVETIDLNEELIEYDESNKDGKFKTPFEFDNNDGVFVIDCRFKKPKFALFTLDFDKNDKWFCCKVSALSYMQKYYGSSIKSKLRDALGCDTEKEFEEEYNDYKDMVKYIDSFETLSESDMNKIFKKIDPEHVNYEMFEKLNNNN